MLMYLPIIILQTVHVSNIDAEDCLFAAVQTGELPTVTAEFAIYMSILGVTSLTYYLKFIQQTKGKVNFIDIFISILVIFF